MFYDITASGQPNLINFNTRFLTDISSGWVSDQERKSFLMGLKESISLTCALIV